MNRFLRAIFGIDFAILRCYPKDLNRFRWGAIAAIVYGLLSWPLFGWRLAIVIGFGVLLLYWWFLCKPSQSVGVLSVLKFFLVLGLVAFGIYVSSHYVCYLPFAKDGVNKEITSDVVGYLYCAFLSPLLLTICIFPVKNNAGDYEKAIENLRKKSASTLETMKLSGHDIGETAIRSWVADIQRQSEEINRAAKQELIRAQQAIIQSAMNSWIESMQKDMAEAFKNVTTETIKVVGQGLSAAELNECVSALVAEQQKEFATIIIDRWAAETKKNLKKENLNKFVKS